MTEIQQHILKVLSDDSCTWLESEQLKSDFEEKLNKLSKDEQIKFWREMCKLVANPSLETKQGKRQRS